MVQQVRTRLHNSIQRLHGIMPLWGIDNWVPLGDLFVDVNILEKTSSSRRSEVGDLWQDFTKGESNYRSLDRIGLGNQQQRVSGLSVLERDTNLMVVGKPGAGKTTYLQRIVTECNNGKLQAQRIPVLIKLREFVDDGRKYGYNLEQFFSQLWRLSNTDTELVISQGRGLVLLDGLDEVTGEGAKQISREIKRFTRAYPQVLVVVTCRTQSQESRFERFDYVEVADFNEEQVRAFAEHWFDTVCGDTGEDKARDFLEQLFREENKAIRELAITPILLSLTCLVFQGKGRFYSKRSKLYEEGLELLLVQWDKSREVERNEVYRDLSVERKLELLSYVAVKKFEQEQYVLFEQEELEGYIGEFLGIERRESQGVLKAIASQHGLLIERSHKVWSFSHLTFQEYLVAKCFVANADWVSLANYITFQHWREVFLISTEITLDANELIQQMKMNTNRIIAFDPEIQNCINWIKMKSELVNSTYPEALLRCFYMDVIFVFNEELNTDDIDNDAIHTLNLLHLLSIDIAIEDEIDKLLLFILTLLLDVICFTSGLAYDLLTQQLSFELTLAFEPQLEAEIAVVIGSSLCSGPQQFLDIISFLESLELNIIDVAVFQELQNFRSVLPSHKNKNLLDDTVDNYNNWFQENISNWNVQIRDMMINYLNIGHTWKFSNEQKLLFHQYYISNKLILDCLNNGCVTNNVIMEKIEDTLLLPFDELETKN